MGIGLATHKHPEHQSHTRQERTPVGDEEIVRNLVKQIIQHPDDEEERYTNQQIVQDVKGDILGGNEIGNDHSGAGVIVGGEDHLGIFHIPQHQIAVLAEASLFHGKAGKLLLHKVDKGSFLSLGPSNLPAI